MPLAGQRINRTTSATRIAIATHESDHVCFGPQSLSQKRAKERLRHLWKREEQLREDKRLLREEKLLVLPVELANPQPFRLSGVCDTRNRCCLRIVANV